MPPMPKGGKRDGSGRPKGVKTAPVNLSLPFHMVEWLNKHGNKSKTVQRLIQREMDKTSE